MQGWEICRIRLGGSGTSPMSGIWCPTRSNDKCSNRGDASKMPNSSSSGIVTMWPQSLKLKCSSRSPSKRWDWDDQDNVTLRRSRTCNGMHAGSSKCTGSCDASTNSSSINSPIWIFKDLARGRGRPRIHEKWENADCEPQNSRVSRRWPLNPSLSPQ